MCIEMVRVHDKYRGVRTMVDTFLKKDKSGGGGYQDFRAEIHVDVRDNGSIWQV